jgi:predicted metal-dependent phosphoesterase TrpH
VSLTDLHLHTTASDGRLSPSELVDEAQRAGLAVMAVTDHDTIAAVEGVQQLARTRGIEAIAGIEVTAVENQRDIHVLGYFLNPRDEAFAQVLSTQRAARVRRAIAIAARLEELGMPTDLGPWLTDEANRSGKSIGRPQVARAMVQAGHVADLQEAFDKWLANDRPAYVTRTGPSPEQVIDAIHRAGGLASLAHPGRTLIDARIPALAAAGLDAIEVYHSDHDATAVGRYRTMARELDVLVTGGSDFHGDPARSVRPGSATLPDEEWQRLRAARHRHALA